MFIDAVRDRSRIQALLVIIQDSVVKSANENIGRKGNSSLSLSLEFVTASARIL